MTRAKSCSGQAASRSAEVSYASRGHARQHKPSATRVDWGPLAELFDFSGRRSDHCGRPSREQVPALNVPALRRQGAADGLMVTIRGLDGDLEIPVAARAVYDPVTGGTLRIAWQSRPWIGDSQSHAMTIKLRPIPRSLGHHPSYNAICPHCGSGATLLFYGVSTFACANCLGLKPESLRSGTIYTAEKTVRRIRAQLGQDQGLLKPIVIGRASPRRRALAERLHDAELMLMSRIVPEEL